MTELALALVLLAAPVRDAGQVVGVHPARLSPTDCQQLLETIVRLSVHESVASDLQSATLNDTERRKIEREAFLAMLKEPGFAELVRACPERYSRVQERCISSATSMLEVDQCSRRR